VDRGAGCAPILARFEWIGLETVAVLVKLPARERAFAVWVLAILAGCGSNGGVGSGAGASSAREAVSERPARRGEGHPAVVER
jgi:hypothetical protein